ncbi:hypothetical protein NQ314_001804 [Rhamnusium bicolor]|uniref:Uncharacterized protein n=1 Tax=Rhamnusium bicolor TaxID=1586634 RepID=A0AAV8ZTW4_9CUCU|nr:hypothetical protein NQ314_001804 [Rhamnusium bicolor]
MYIDWVDYMSRLFANAAVPINEETEVLTPTGLATLLYGVLNWVNMNKPETVKNFVLLRVFLYLAPDSDAKTRAAFEDYYRGINLALLPR